MISDSQKATLGLRSINSNIYSFRLENQKNILLALDSRHIIDKSLFILSGRPHFKAGQQRPQRVKKLGLGRPGSPPRKAPTLATHFHGFLLSDHF
jgi:hypothetical protein